MPLDLRIQLFKLEIFCRVVELESVTKAANELFISQPVATAHVRHLQQRLGLPLLYRDGHSMRTTDAGQLAYEWAKDVLTRSEEMARRMEGLADGRAGAAALAASMTVGSYLLPPILARFQRNRPQARIGLDISDPEQAQVGVEAGRFDLGIVIADAGSLGPNLQFEELGKEDLVLVTDSASAIPAEITGAELAETSVVGAQSQVRAHLVHQALSAQGFESGPVALEVGHAEGMKRAVAAGAGVAFLFRSSVQAELERGELREVTVTGLPNLDASIYLVHRKRKNFSQFQEDLIASIREALGPP